MYKTHSSVSSFSVQKLQVHIIHKNSAFSRLAEYLTALTKKYARFKWTEDCQLAFDTVKDHLTAVLLLT